MVRRKRRVRHRRRTHRKQRSVGFSIFGTTPPKISGGGFGMLTFNTKKTRSPALSSLWGNLGGSGGSLLGGSSMFSSPWGTLGGSSPQPTSRPRKQPKRMARRYYPNTPHQAPPSHSEAEALANKTMSEMGTNFKLGARTLVSAGSQGARVAVAGTKTVGGKVHEGVTHNQEIVRYQMLRRKQATSGWNSLTDAEKTELTKIAIKKNEEI